MSYAGGERRVENRWKLTKTFDFGTLISLIVLLFALFGISNKVESRITALETRVLFLMDRMK